MNFISLIAALAAGISVTCLMLLGFHFFRRFEVDSEQTSESRQLPVIFRMMLPLTPNLIRLIQGPSFVAVREKTQQQLQMAGYDLAINADQMLSIRIIYGLFGTLFLFFTVCTGQAITGLLFFALLLIYPGVWLRTKIQKRHLEMFKALPNMLDLLTLSVEAGKDFLSALRDIVNRRKKDALSEEFDRTLKEIQIGKTRATAMKDLGKRVQLPELTTIVNAIVQAEELGVSIAELLRIQGDLLRNKRFARAEKLANEAPVKILLPIVLFIFPSVFIILMGPTLMHAFKLLSR